MLRSQKYKILIILIQILHPFLSLPEIKKIIDSGLFVTKFLIHD